MLEDAVAFTFATLAAHLTSGDRILLDVLSGQHVDVMGGISTVLDELVDVKAAIAAIDRPKSGFSSANMESQVDMAAIDAAILSEIQRMKRRRFIQDDRFIKDVKAFEGRLKDGLSYGSPAVRAEGFREIAIVYVRDELIAEARAALAIAESLCTIDLTPERARILNSEKNYDGALKLVRNRQDAASVSQFIQAICLRDGSEEALNYFKNHYTSENLTGHALFWLSCRMTDLSRLTDAKTLLSQASTTQIDENPVILFQRGRLSMALAMAPDIATRFMESQESIPKPEDYSTDQAGQALLLEAISDFQNLLASANETSNDNLSATASCLSLSIRLSLRDNVERNKAEAELRRILSDPKKVLEFAPLALACGVDFDREKLREQLDSAERFGGWDRTQLHAAFIFTLHDQPPDRVASFLAKHEKQLGAFLAPSKIIGFRIEALAKSNDIDGAEDLLAAHEADLEKDDVHSFRATIDEYSGLDSVSARLSQFESNGSTHNLEILLSALSKVKDSRLGHYLALLWTRKHQLIDAAKACDAFMWNGQTEALDAFLDTLSDHIPQHHHLSMHAAWKLQRQGELSGALGILDRLNTDGADNHNIRQLRVSILLELGRWNELEPFLQSEVAAKDDRSAITLMGVAQLATTLNSPTALSLVRASLGKGDESPQLYMAAYQVALNLGVERSAEVNGWLKAAIEGSTEDGPIYTKDIDDAVELMREGRERHEKLNAMIMAAELPLSLAAKPMNVTLSAIYLGQAWENRKNADPRKHNLIPAYAGNRLFWNLPEDPVISFDVTSLLTLQSIGMLGKVLSAFDKVVLPAGTMSQIFQDYSGARHTQPSRVQQAQEIKRLIAACTLTIEKCDPANEELESEVGAEFARLYQAATKTDGYVIDTAPSTPTGQAQGNCRPKSICGQADQSQRADREAKGRWCSERYGGQ